MAKASPSEIAAATLKGVKSKQPDGTILHTYRHPSSPDYQITVHTKNGKVMKSSVDHKPMKEIDDLKKKERGEAKAKADKTKAAKAEQLAKKRARSAKASMKKGNKTKN